MPDSYFDSFRHGLQAQRDLFTAGVRELGFTATESEGTYFLTTDLGPLSGYPDALAAARDLPRRAGVVAIPQQELCDDKTVGAQALRWAYCKRPEVLSEALERLSAVTAGSPSHAT
jgi:N-succinyldiaminopimelate aminotransferase